MFCLKCGKDMQDDAVFCPNCGFSSGKAGDSIRIHSKVKPFLLTSLVLNCIEAIAAIIVFALTFTMKDDISYLLTQLGIPYEGAQEMTGTVFMYTKVLCGIIAVITLVIGFVNFFAGISGKVVMRDNYRFYVKDHISSASACGAGAFIMGIFTAYIRSEAGAENAMSVFPIFLFLLIMALVHFFMAMLPAELSKLENAEVNEIRVGRKIVLCGIAVIIVVAAIFIVIHFIFSGIGLNGKYGHYMESENRYGYTIEFNSDGSCLLKEIYGSEIISGDLEKNDSGSYSINWDRYYGTWIIQKNGDELLVRGAGVGNEGTVFERIK